MVKLSWLFLAVLLLSVPTLAAIPGCLNSFFSLGVEKCVTCSTTYRLTLDGRCEACTSGCSTCLTSAGVCDICMSGYFKTPTSTCSACMAGCSSCFNALTCNSCKSYFFRGIDQKCYPCVANCFSCSSTTTCFSCDINYTKKTQNGVDKCEGSSAGFIILIVLLILLFLCLPLIICCVCWASIAACLGWSTSQSSSTVYVDSGPTHADFDTHVVEMHHSPPPPAYQPGFGAEPGFGHQHQPGFGQEPGFGHHHQQPGFGQEFPAPPPGHFQPGFGAPPPAYHHQPVFAAPPGHHFHDVEETVVVTTTTEVHYD